MNRSTAGVFKLAQSSLPSLRKRQTAWIPLPPNLLFRGFLEGRNFLVHVLKATICCRGLLTASVSLETTHGLIRAQFGVSAFLFVSAIVDRFQRFATDVVPRLDAQNTIGAHNAGVVVTWVLSSLDQQPSPASCQQFSSPPIPITDCTARLIGSRPTSAPGLLLIARSSSGHFRPFRVFGDHMSIDLFCNSNCVE